MMIIVIIYVFIDQKELKKQLGKNDNKTRHRLGKQLYWESNLIMNKIHKHN